MKISRKKASPQEIKLTPGNLVRLKDNIGNTLGMMKLDEDQNLVIYPVNGVKIWDNPFTISIPTRQI